MVVASPDSEDLTVKIGGQTVGGWTGARVVRGIERLPSGVALELTELYPGQDAPTVIVPGQDCQVYLGADLILTGYANLYWPHEDMQTHIVRSEARSKTQDLVDCSLAPPAALPPWHVLEPTIGSAAKRLCKPFGIEVVLPDGDAPLLVPFVINPGETVAELIEYMARTVQMLMYDDPQGRLVLGKASNTRAGSPLVEGINCEVAEARISDDQRFQTIYVVGQGPSPGSTPPILTQWASRTDTGVKRYRPKLIVMDMPGPALEWAQKRADWEVARRIGRSLIIDVQVTGWRDGAGALWTPNTVVNCNIPSLKVNRDLLIAEVAWMRNEQGTSSLITLMPREGFIPEPYFFQLLPGLNDSTSPAKTGT